MKRKPNSIDKIKAKSKADVAKIKAKGKAESGYAARKLEGTKQRNRTLRTTAIANAASSSVKSIADAKKNEADALQRWNTLINGSEKEGQSQPNDTGDTVKTNNEGDYIFI